MRLTTSSSHTRPGVILLVVIAMLALFAVVGLAFVYYAQAEADASRISTQIQNKAAVDSDPEMLLAYVLNQLIFDVNDRMDSSQTMTGNGPPTNHNIGSSLRGHSFARNMYGYNRFSLNVSPFNGISRSSTAMSNLGNETNTNQPFSNLINRRYFPGDGAYYFAGGKEFIFDPDRYGTLRDANTANFLFADPPKGQVYVGHNVPWTYADLDTVFLGQMNGSGDILIQSFWRPWTISATTSLDKNNDPLWTPYDPTNLKAAPPPERKYQSMRPLPWYNRGDPAIAMFPHPKKLIGTRPGSAPGFPGPEDLGGDVINVEAGQGVNTGGNHTNNDSIWVDVGFPVRRGPDGRLYKPLVAMFITDLDGKLNLNIAGNVRGNNGTPQHASNHGLYPSEINISKLLNKHPTEWMNVLGYKYNGGSPGKAGWFIPGGGASPPSYAFLDFDAVQTNSTLSDPIYLPGSWPTKAQDGNQTDPNLGKTVPFEWVKAATYGTGSVAERTNHPALFNFYNPTYFRGVGVGGDNTNANNQIFSIHQLEALYRFTGTGSPMLTADLFQWLPQNFGSGGFKQRLCSTLLSSDLIRPGVTPWLTGALGQYQLTNSPNPPIGNSTNQQPVNSASPNAGEYGLDYRGFAGKDPNPTYNPNARSAFAKLNLARTLTDYPLPDGTGHIDLSNKANVAQLNQAIQDRQDMCQDIFDLLRYVCTGARPGAALPGAGQDYDALRWLAQLSANIVDLRDTDNISTVFLWDQANKQYVFGTELSGLQINEAYAEMQNDPKDNGLNNVGSEEAKKDYNVNFWVELINPQRQVNNPYTNTLNDERIQLADAKGNPDKRSVYKLTILGPPDRINTNSNDVQTLRQTAANPTGDPDPLKVKLDVVDFNPNNVKLNVAQHFRVQALDANQNDASQKNVGFYILGPQTNTLKANAGATGLPAPTLEVDDQNIAGTRSAMTYDLDKKWFESNVQKTPTHTILLRRLANPHLPDSWTGTVTAQGQNNQKVPNPYVTVDYVQDVPTYDAVEFDSTSNGVAHVKPMNNPRQSYGRTEPYIAANFANGGQTTAGGANAPNNTFWSHNSNLQNPVRWLPFLDRNYTSPAELFYVSGYRPHELTQTFDGTTGHLAKWTTAANRIYRFLDFVDAGNRMAGVSQDGVFPGKININTVWDREIFRALCDANNTSIYTESGAQGTTVDNIWQSILNQRSPSAGASQVTSSDKPFHSFSTPDTGGANEGFTRTLLGNNLPLVTQDSNGGAVNNAVFQNQLFNKIFNNITTRSNVFAIWMTVGFFEVYEWPNNPADDADPKYWTANGPDWTSAPAGTHYELGREIGKDENRNIRHRMFAIVDRTSLFMPFNLSKLTANAAAKSSGPFSVSNTALSINAVTSPSGAVIPYRLDFALQPGMEVQIDTEVVTIALVDHANLQFTTAAPLQQKHNANALITVPNDRAVPVQIDVPGSGAQNFTITGGANLGGPLIHGNAGPQLRFDHRSVPTLVPHYSILQ